METVELFLGERSYPIHIGSGLLADGELLRRQVRGREVFIVTNETIAPLYLEQVRSAFDGYRVQSLALPDGEEYKTLASFEAILTALLQHGHKRSTTVIALGGGVVGDVAGFAAACYQRGVDFVQMPTTLLAQVDSSVGGKTAVNHELGKNMIGAFHQPRAVIIDTATLRTLPPREFSAGLAEIIKHGALADEEYLSQVEKGMPRLLAGDEKLIAAVIRRSCEIKAAVVSADEKEAGARALLNLGHTFGHAIEAALGYGEWLHGEAVGAGMVMAADLSWRLGMLERADGERLRRIVSAARLPVAPPGNTAGRLEELMQRDKKATDDGLTFVLLEGLGKATLVKGVDAEKLARTLDAGDALLAA